MITSPWDMLMFLLPANLWSLKCEKAAWSLIGQLWPHTVPAVALWVWPAFIFTHHNMTSTNRNKWAVGGRGAGGAHLVRGPSWAAGFRRRRSTQSAGCGRGGTGSCSSPPLLWPDSPPTPSRCLPPRGPGGHQLGSPAQRTAAGSNTHLTAGAELLATS